MTRASYLIARWGPVVVWMGVIFALSSQSTFPRGPDPLAEVLARKLAHLSEYAVLAILLARALAASRTLTVRTALLALAITLAYAASDEIHQGFVPQRMPSAVDVVIDLVGGLIGLGLWQAWTSNRREQTSARRHLR